MNKKVQPSLGCIPKGMPHTNAAFVFNTEILAVFQHTEFRTITSRPNASRESSWTLDETLGCVFSDGRIMDQTPQTVLAAKNHLLDRLLLTG